MHDGHDNPYRILTGVCVNIPIPHVIRTQKAPKLPFWFHSFLALFFFTPFHFVSESECYTKGNHDGIKNSDVKKTFEA